jgi:hypothetical protein
MPAYRVCPIHRSDIVDGPDTADGREIIRCLRGHPCRRWLVINHKGMVVGSGSAGAYRPKENSNGRSSRSSSRS